MMRFSFAMCLLFLLGASVARAGEPKPPADLVVLNGKVWTVDPAMPRAEAIAVVGERIAAVGSNEEIKKWVGPNTRTIDARGKSVLPGMIDAHVHFSTGGFDISGVQLKDTRTREEFARRIGEHAKKLAKGEWMLGGTWDHENWPGAPLPTREWIDALTPDNPVFVSRYDGHMALANTLALRLAGVTRDTPVPAGGEIVKDANGEPTGVFKDAASSLVYRVIPDPTEEQLTRAVKAALTEAARFGVTSMHDISSAADVRVYQQLLARSELTARIYCITPIQQWEAPARTGIRANFGNKWIRVGALKGFADGSLGSTTALFFEPYVDAPNTTGLPNQMMFPEGNMQKMALGADRAGLQLAIHAIGDKAIRMILDTFAEVEKQNGRRDTPRRWRIEHAQHMHPDDFVKFARLGVIASMQPYHAIDDGRWAEKRIGHERGKMTYAFRTFLDKGVKLAFGSDWTVAPLNPMTGIYAAVTRATLDGKNPGGWYPQQKISLAEAIEAYTMGSAYAEFAEREKGSLTAGKLADIVVLDADLFAIAPERLKDAKVVSTVVGGRVVFEGKR
ncbi:MAG: amidohydrolase [Acidobacteria bacterium]|nr:amidohydrolase [Acidobacteriota bacterium]MCL5287955.1 amidohydrolase [Acidobacteriota bacterium]